MPGTVIRDVLVPYEIRNSSGALLYKGNVQDRVVRRPDNTLVFDVNLRDSQSGLNGIVRSVTRYSYASLNTKVSYDAVSTGTVAPFQASRSAGAGPDITWRFISLSSSQGSQALEISTDATAFNTNGSTLIGLTTGEVVVVPTSQPGVGIATATIVAPGEFSCNCSPINITGTASATSGFANYTVEYSSSAAGPWTTILTSSSQVINGTLATWNAAALPSGYYYLRLRVRQTDGTETSFVKITNVDNTNPTAVMRYPVDSGVYGGTICFDGTADDYPCFNGYSIGIAPAGSGSYVTLVNSGAPVVNDPLGNFNFGGYGDGMYDVRLSVRDACGRVSNVTKTIEIDNTPPFAKIFSPVNCGSIDGTVQVIGSAFDRNISFWTVSIVGGPFNDWQTIGSGNSNVVNGLLASWDTSRLPPCCYTIRLSAWDQASVNCSSSHYSEYLTTVDLGGTFCPTDFNNDGGIDGADVNAFFSAWEDGSCR